MIKKACRLLYNSIRFIGRSDYGHLLAVDTSTRIEKSRRAVLRIGSGLRTRRNVEILARDGELTIGDEVFLNSGCIVTARESITIGSGTIFGPNVLVYDHDHRVENGKIQSNAFVSQPIVIGKNVWVGAGTIILKGAVLEDNCVIAAGSVVKGVVPKDSVFVQKRERTVLPL